MEQPLRPQTPLNTKLANQSSKQECFLGEKFTCRLRITPIKLHTINPTMVDQTD